ncbi:MAG: DegT/DnrJ/EryC1/StrS family aminotransferase [Deltaproteobacteria bacterium]|nr:DegT/DnrJ/EryC1/StrS family aminotransferase [Deltaproteobacteria bacterium]
MEFIDLKRQYQLRREVIDQALAEVAASARYIMGPQVAELEERLAEFVGVRQAVGVGSGTDALLVALMALGLKPGDEVICPAFTFIAAAETVALLGGRPVLADVEPQGGTLDPQAVEAAVSQRTVGLIPVNLFGQCARLEELEAVASRLGLWLIEDGAQSFGAQRKGRMSCSFGQIAITSFFPAKPLGCMGDGGMAFTNDPALAETMRSLRVHGDGGRYQHVDLGLNARLDTLQAAVLLAKMSFFEEELELRNQAAAVYDRALSSVDGLEIPVLLEGNTSVWAQYTVKTENRDGLADHLHKKGIPTAVHYPRPLQDQPIFKKIGRAPVGLKVAEELSRRVLSLPMHPYLTPEEQDRVVQAVDSFKRTESAA